MSTPINLIGNLQSGLGSAADAATGAVLGHLPGKTDAAISKAAALAANPSAALGDAGNAVTALTAGAGQLVTRAGLFGVGLVLLCIGLWVVVKG